MKNVIVLLSTCLVFLACNNENTATTEKVTNTVTTSSTAISGEKDINIDAARIADLTCKLFQLMPDTLKDNTVMPEEYNKVLEEVNALKPQMEQRYPKATGEWDTFEHKVGEIMNVKCN